MKPRHETDPEPPLPPRLGEAFRTLPRQEIFVPPAIGARITAAAQRQLTPPPRSPRFWLWARPVRRLAPVLAAIVLAGGVGFWVATRDQAGTRAAIMAEDLNHDGRLDVLDALQLARQLQQGQSSRAWDFNRDGIIDQQDARALAQRAVQLPPKVRS